MRSRFLSLILLLGLSLPALSTVANAASLTNWLPISSITPGAINTAVTQKTIAKTICIIGYTKTIRPPASYTTALKRQQLASTYSRYGSTATSIAEEDHLIPLELGGNPSSVKNLWPQIWNGAWGARKKDQLENKLHLLVCAQQLALDIAQKAIATNWITAYGKYVLELK